MSAQTEDRRLCEEMAKVAPCDQPDELAALLHANGFGDDPEAAGRCIQSMTKVRAELG